MAKRLALESLELRILLAADVTLRSSGELLITGDDLANVVKVFQAGHLMMVDAGDDGSHSFAVSAVSRIRFLGRWGTISSRITHRFPPSRTAIKATTS